MATGVLQRGTTFSDGMVVNAATLNNLVDLGDVLTALIANKSPVAPASGNFILFTDGTNLFKCTFSQISASGAGGVSSVGLTMPATEFNITGTPITGSGTLGVTWDNQPINTFLAGPKTGSPSAPNFRVISPSDLAIPSVNIAAANIDWSLANTFWKVLAGNITFSFTNATAQGQVIKVLLSQPGGGTATVNWPTGTGGVYWRGGVQPIMTTGAGRTDLYTFHNINNTILGWSDQNFVHV